MRKSLLLALLTVLLPFVSCGTRTEPPTNQSSQTNKSVRELYVAAATSNMQRMTDLLERDPHLIKTAEDIKQSPLLAALNSPKPPTPEIIALLLDKGADIKARDGVGNSALHIGAMKGLPEIVSLLCARGADVAARNRQDRTALDLALYFRRDEIAQMLLDHGATPDVFQAAALGQLEQVESLIERRPDVVHLTDGYGRTLLHWAALHGHVDVAELLLEKGVNPETQDKSNMTALDLAAEGKKTKMQELLRGRAKEKPRTLSHGGMPQ